MKRRLHFSATALSNFKNPNGLDNDSHYVTAHDLGLITCYALKNKLFSDVVKTNSKIITTVDGTDKFLSNHNKMLYMYDGCVGVKTGFTKNSGRTLVTAAKRGNIGLVAVTLSAPDDWNDHKKLLDKGFEDVTEEMVVDNTVTVDNISVFGGVKQTVGVRCAEEYYGIKIKNFQAGALYQSLYMLLGLKIHIMLFINMINLKLL